jgi:integrase/recombinase XerD
MRTEQKATSLVLAAPGPASGAAGHPAPVEYAVAVDRYLGQAALGAASRRVYRISLASWAWPLVGRPAPAGAQRRNAAPPVVALARLDDPDCAGTLAAALAARAAGTDARTVNRELSTLRSAVGWWREQGWIAADPLAGLRHVTPGALARPLSEEQVSQVLRLPASLREHALWRLLHDCGAPATQVLALDADRLDLSRHRARPRPGGQPARPVEWREPTSQVLRWLLAGRTWGPVFLTERRAPAGNDPADTCRLTGQARMSYRRAAEVFTARTRPLDPAGHGWTLHQLSASRRPA